MWDFALITTEHTLSICFKWILFTKCPHIHKLNLNSNIKISSRKEKLCCTCIIKLGYNRQTSWPKVIYCSYLNKNGTFLAFFDNFEPFNANLAQYLAKSDTPVKNMPLGKYKFTSLTSYFYKQNKIFWKLIVESTRFVKLCAILA